MQGRLHRADGVVRAVFGERHFVDVKDDDRRIRIGLLIEVIGHAEVDIGSSYLTEVQLVDTGVILCKRGVAEVRQHEVGDAAARITRKDPHYLVRRRSAVSSKVNHRSAGVADSHGISACTRGLANRNGVGTHIELLINVQDAVDAIETCDGISCRCLSLRDIGTKGQHSRLLVITLHGVV